MTYFFNDIVAVTLQKLKL